MKEIKFRAWKSWRKPTMLYSGQFDIKWSAEDGRYQAIDRTRFDSQWDMPLMQYTGLKDKNGKEIYEGDIVQLAQFIIEVKWVNEFSRFTNKDDYTGFFPKNIEVIGNIYENPELLK